MLTLFEQYGYCEERRCIDVNNDNHISILRSRPCHKRNIKRKGYDQFCYQIDYEEKEGKPKFYFQSSYFVGIDWIVEGQLPIYIQPKLNRINDNKKNTVEIDYIRMLVEALQESENFKHLEGLCEINFNNPYIYITQKQDFLSPFLIAQFLQLLRQIVRKGLKKSYYTISDNLNAKVKGKILIAKDIKENKLKGNHISTACQFQEFGVNCDENKILKKAYIFSRKAIQCYEKGIEIESLRHIIDYIYPAFETVSEHIEISKIKSFKPNPLYKEYDQALKLAQLILKRYSYNITLTEKEEIPTPPFWIDMSKLFELYVYQKLRAVFDNNEVSYHSKAQYQELDFIIRSKDDKYLFIVDAKYKPRYEEHKISIEDIRQISGYARIKKVYDELKITDYDKNLNCLIIYSHQNCNESFDINSFILRNEDTDYIGLKKEAGYVNIFKLGIRLPEIC